MKHCRPDVFFTTVSYPIKGTPYFNKVADRLVTVGDWHNATDRDTSIRDGIPAISTVTPMNYCAARWLLMADPASVSMPRARALRQASDSRRHSG